jgi:hypothetical protein
MTYVLVDLVVTTPPVWWRLEVASDVYLRDVHQTSQVHAPRRAVGVGFSPTTHGGRLCERRGN